MARSGRRTFISGPEPLESRIALANVTTVGNTLSITDTSGHDRILIGAAGPGMLRVVFDGANLGRFGPVAKLTVDAGAGNNTLLLGPRVKIPAVIDGGAGNDTLRTWPGPDRRCGDDGNHTLIAGRNRDVLDAGTGNNRLSVPQSMGAIYVGPSASGAALRTLSKAYTLRPLRSTMSVGPMVVGTAALDNARTVARLQAAYQAGDAVALTNPTAADVDRLRGLIGQQGGLSPDAKRAPEELVVFRKALRPDGGTSYQSIAVDRPPPASAALSTASRHRVNEEYIEILSQYFSKVAVVPNAPSAEGGTPSLMMFADSTEASQVQEDSHGNVVQIVDMVWSGRAFQSMQDYYLVNQEVDYTANVPYPGALTSWFNRAATSIPSSLNETIFATSPGSTMEATTVTNSVSHSITESVGVNESQGLNASTTEGVTVSSSKSYTVPPVQITNQTDLVLAIASWAYKVNDLPKIPETISFYNQWYWVVGFGAYQPDQENVLIATEANSYLDFKKNVRPDKQTVTDTLHFLAPLPFGQTFALQQPVVTGLTTPDTFDGVQIVPEGEQFTIHGTGMYPSLVTAVLIGGVPLSPSNYKVDSDTQITVIAPDQASIFPQSVVVQTTQGLSNDNEQVEIVPNL